VDQTFLGVWRTLCNDNQGWSRYVYSQYAYLFRDSLQANGYGVVSLTSLISNKDPLTLNLFCKR
jgi:hypothetical protein